MTAPPSAQSGTERFTLQIQGRGLRIKVRIPGWAIASIWRFAKEAERA